MKNKSSGSGLSYYFTKRIYGRDQDKMLELIRPDSELERSKGFLENILRWEDDGGQMFCIGNSIDQSNPDMARELAIER